MERGWPSDAIARASEAASEGGLGQGGPLSNELAGSIDTA